MPINIISRSAALLRAGGTSSFSDFATTGLPAGVTLQAIDGGPTYYADNGFTRAVNMGWDSSSFFPLGIWFGTIPNQAAANRWLDLSLNTMFIADGSTVLSVLVSNGIGAIQGAGDTLSSTNTVGLLTFDEPTVASQMRNPVTATANAIQDGRFWWTNFTHNQIDAGEMGGVTMVTLFSELLTTPNATQRHQNILSMDQYYCAGADGPGTSIPAQAGSTYQMSRDMTAAECRRPCHYGDMIAGGGDIDFPLRAQQAANFPAPIFQFVENGGPYSENTTAGSYIKPPEMNAAIWGLIIKGCRGIIYFNHSFAGPGSSSDNFANSYYTTIQSGNSISIYDQAKATNALIVSLAPIINSPFAIGYVTVSPAATVITNSTSDSGFDVAAKYYNVSGGNNKFYIFAMPRFSASITNQTATFTIKDTGATQVTVIDESRTISITGGTTFTDNFAANTTVHIYRVD